ncbi:MAG: DUF5916 domain-containing protein [Candidatus Eiseniibacteriota bacterium]
MPRVICALLLIAALLPVTLLAPLAQAAAPTPGPPMAIQRAAGPIELDGDLSDAGWSGITPITQWYETNVGDNVEPQVKNVAWLAYDGTYLYAAFQFEDPTPDKVRRPLGDHDAVNSSTDYAGVIVDSRNDGKTAQMFLSNPSGVQYDAMSSDVSGEDNAPDFYWDSVGQVTSTGWNLEIRVPFSSLRYSNEATPTWGMLLYRNYPRDRRYQFFSARLPRDVNCFICNSSKMTGLAELPKGSHLVVAPYATASKNDEPETGLGSPLTDTDIEPKAGFDIKWSPIADFAVDGTYKPDFSQIESDVAQIGANERFALFYPEKRPFFLEGIDLFAAPMRTVYTRTITEPELGLRGTGRLGGTSLTALVTQDQGGGLVIIPGPQGSTFAPQDFESNVGIFRVRRDLGQSFISALATVRNNEGDDGHNTVIGPDFQWRPNPKDNVTGQFVWSDTKTPNRPELASEWDGRSLSDHAFTVYYSHGGRYFDFFTQGQDIGADFRADDGFIPQVGYREVYLESGWTFRPKDDFLSRIRVFTVNWLDWLPDDNGQMLSRRISVGTGMDGKLNSFLRIELNQDDFLVGTEELGRFRPRVQITAVPSLLFNNVSLDTYFGGEVDFDNAREGTGTTIVTGLTVRPNRHLELRNDASRRALNVDDPTLGSGRLFTAWVERLRATWAFNSRSFVRVIGQYVETTRDPSLYTFPVAAKDAGFGASGLFAYKLNWQTVAYLGYGDQRAFYETTDTMEKATRQIFAKISYAWQR